MGAMPSRAQSEFYKGLMPIKLADEAPTVFTADLKNDRFANGQPSASEETSRGQEQIARAVDQLTAGQEHLTREIVKLEASQYGLSKSIEPPPRPVHAPTPKAGTRAVR